MNLDVALTRPNATFVKLFGAYLRTYFRRHFTALRISNAHPLPVLGPDTILYSNHPSWWDPVVMLIFAAGPFAKFRVFAPIEHTALARYPILRRLGLFGIETGTLAGTRRFIETSDAILSDPGHLLVTTAQGRFADVRERPADLRSGVAHLLHADLRRVAVPVALEYMHWNARLPEALVAFGEPRRAKPGESTAQTTRQLESGLVHTIEALGCESIRRDPSRFDCIVGGKHTDVSGIYGAWGGIRRLLGKPPASPAGSRDAASEPKT